MATQTETPEKNPVKKAPTPGEDIPSGDRRVVAAPVSSPVPAGLNDTRADNEPILGQFVEVASGKYKGAYGVFLQVEGEDTAIVRTRDENGERIAVPISSLVRSRAGKR